MTGSGPHEALAETFEQQRERLVAVAYRMLGIAPILVPLAASGLALVMTGAVILRIRRGETKAALADGGYLVLALFVAIGRFALEPFTG